MMVLNLQVTELKTDNQEEPKRTTSVSKLESCKGWKLKMMSQRLKCFDFPTHLNQESPKYIFIHAIATVSSNAPTPSSSQPHFHIRVTTQYPPEKYSPSSHVLS